MNMKTVKICLIQMIAAAVLSLGLSITALAAQVHGNVDEIHEDSISGWAWDAQAPDVPLTVQITITDAQGSLIHQETAEASLQRDDVAASGYGSGACGFSLPVDWSGLPDGAYTVPVSTTKASPPFVLWAYLKLPATALVIPAQEDGDGSPAPAP